MTARWLPLIALALLSAPAAAESLEGSWALDAGGTAIFRFDISKAKDGHWQASWAKPRTFASDGNNFSHLSGPPNTVASMTAIDIPGGIEIAFNDPRPGAIPDIFDVRPIDRDAVELTYVGTGLAPYTLERVKPGSAIGPWDPKLTYSRDKAAAAETQAAAAPPLPPLEPTAPDPSTFKLQPGAMVGR